MNQELRTKWLMYTVVIGLIPILLRLILFSFGLNVSALNPSDFIAFGFVLHISILNEIEYINNDRVWKTIQNAFSIVAIIIYALLIVVLMFRESGFTQLNISTIKNYCIVSSIISLIISLTVFYRPNIQLGDV